MNLIAGSEQTVIVVMFSSRKIILFIVFLITLSVSAYVLLVAIPTRLAERSYEGAKQIGEDIRKAFQITPEVTVNNTVVLQQQTPVFELAVLSQAFKHEYEWMNTWMGSTKKIEIKGTFQAKAGFDLHKKFTVSINDDEATVVLPEPQLLSITPKDDVVFRDENGIWNWVDGSDRSAAMNAYTRDARKYAAQADFIQNARKIMAQKLEEIFRAHGKTVHIRYEDNINVQPI